jgi:hypothetical protein
MQATELEHNMAELQREVADFKVGCTFRAAGVLSAGMYSIPYGAGQDCAQYVCICGMQATELEHHMAELQHEVADFQVGCGVLRCAEPSDPSHCGPRSQRACTAAGHK